MTRRDMMERCLRSLTLAALGATARFPCVEAAMQTWDLCRRVFALAHQSNPRRRVAIHASGDIRSLAGLGGGDGKLTGRIAFGSAVQVAAGVEAVLGTRMFRAGLGLRDEAAFIAQVQTISTAVRQLAGRPHVRHYPCFLTSVPACPSLSREYTRLGLAESLECKDLLDRGVRNPRDLHVPLSAYERGPHIDLPRSRLLFAPVAGGRGGRFVHLVRRRRATTPDGRELPAAVSHILGRARPDDRDCLQSGRWPDRVPGSADPSAGPAACYPGPALAAFLFEPRGSWTEAWSYSVFLPLTADGRVRTLNASVRHAAQVLSLDPFVRHTLGSLCEGKAVTA